MRVFTDQSLGESDWGKRESYYDSYETENSGENGTQVSRKSEGRPQATLERSIERTIESEIIPRLLLMHRADPVNTRAANGKEWIPGPETVPDFVDVLLDSGNFTEVHAFVAAIRDQGAALDSIYLDLLAPAARLLGDYWVADLRNFTDVTIALSLLQQLLRNLAANSEYAARPARAGHRALVSPAPGEQHTFGVFMVEELLRQEGWDIRSEPSATENSLASIVHEDWFELIGLSLSSARWSEDLASAIRLIRRSSKNSQVCVMVGGNAFLENPTLVEDVGADETAADGRQIVEKAEKLLEQIARRC